MRYIIALARERHFGKAADACHVSQPTLFGVAIKKVEASWAAHSSSAMRRKCASPLWRARGGPGPAGAGGIGQAQEIAKEGPRPLAGPLRLGVIYTIAPYLLPPLIPALHRCTPPCRSSSGRTSPQSDPGAEIRRTRRHRHRPAYRRTGPGGPTGPTSLSGWWSPPVIRGPPPGSGGRRTRRPGPAALGPGQLLPRPGARIVPHLNSPDALEHSLEGGSLETIRHMVASGAGVAVMPSTAARSPGWQGIPGQGYSPFAGPSPPGAWVSSGV